MRAAHTGSVETVTYQNGGRDSANGNRAEPVEIWKARNYIREKGEDGLSLKKVAEAVNISPNYLSEKFKRVTGENFVAYITRHRIEKARDLLRDPKIRISEIAFAVGFESLSQFNRSFKKLTRESPSQLRMRLLQNGHDPSKGTSC